MQFCCFSENRQILYLTQIRCVILCGDTITGGTFAGMRMGFQFDDDLVRRFEKIGDFQDKSAAGIVLR